MTLTNSQSQTLKPPLVTQHQTLHMYPTY